MDTYVIMLSVTIEQEQAIKSLFEQRGWMFFKTGSRQLLREELELMKTSVSKDKFSDNLFKDTQVHSTIGYTENMSAFQLMSKTSFTRMPMLSYYGLGVNDTIKNQRQVFSSVESIYRNQESLVNPISSSTVGCSNLTSSVLDVSHNMNSINSDVQHKKVVNVNEINWHLQPFCSEPMNSVQEGSQSMDTTNYISKSFILLDDMDNTPFTESPPATTFSNPSTCVSMLTDLNTPKTDQLKAPFINTSVFTKWQKNRQLNEAESLDENVFGVKLVDAQSNKDPEKVVKDQEQNVETEFEDKEQSTEQQQNKDRIDISKHLRHIGQILRKGLLKENEYERVNQIQSKIYDMINNEIDWSGQMHQTDQKEFNMAKENAGFCKGKSLPTTIEKVPENEKSSNEMRNLDEDKQQTHTNGNRTDLMNIKSDFMTGKFDHKLNVSDAILTESNTCSKLAQHQMTLGQFKASVVSNQSRFENTHDLRYSNSKSDTVDTSSIIDCEDNHDVSINKPAKSDTDTVEFNESYHRTSDRVTLGRENEAKYDSVTVKISEGNGVIRKKKFSWSINRNIRMHGCHRKLTTIPSDLNMNNYSKMEKGFFCRDCMFIFRTEKQVKLHKDLKGGDCSPNCLYCDKDSLKDVFQCTKCPKCFKTEELLEKHMERHAASDRQCTLCECVFQTALQLKNHTKSTHMENLAVIYLCDLCGAKFKEKKVLNAHRKYVHTNDRPETCPTCGSRFKTKSQLKNHQVKHKKLDEWNLSCEICGKMFLRVATLKDHVRRHRKDYRLFCNICGKGFYKKHGLDDHMRIHTGIKPFDCKLCNYKCALRCNLLKHIKIHHQKNL